MKPLLLGIAVASLAACATVAPPSPAAQGLAGSRWTLVAFQSSDDAIDRVVPPSVERYVVEFRPEGRLLLQLDCNRANGRWEAPNAASGELKAMGGAMTRAACQPGALDTQIARDLGRVRSYIIRGDRLFMSLEADSGTYEWLKS